MIRYRHHTLTSLFAVGSTTLSIFSGTIMNYATRSFPTNLPTHGNFILLHRITRGGGNSSVRFVLRNALTNYLRHITLNRIIALNPTFNRHQNKGNLLPNLNPMRHPDISTKHKYMTFLLSYNRCSEKWERIDEEDEVLRNVAARIFPREISPPCSIYNDIMFN